MKISKVTPQDVTYLTDPMWVGNGELRFMTGVGKKYNVWNNVNPKGNEVVKVVEHPSITDDTIYLFEESE